MDRYFVPPYLRGRFFPDICINGLWLACLFVGILFAGLVLSVAEFLLPDMPLLTALMLVSYLAVFWYFTSRIPPMMFKKFDRRIRRLADLIDQAVAPSDPLENGHRWVIRQLSSNHGTMKTVAPLMVIFFAGLGSYLIPHGMLLLAQGESLSFIMTNVAIVVFCAVYAAGITMVLLAALLSKISGGRIPT